VVGLLQDVPIHLGSGPVDPANVVLTTFHVLEAPGYHFILGRQFFSRVSGMVDIGGHRVIVTTPAAGRQVYPTIPQTRVRGSTVYREAMARLSAAATRDAGPSPRTVGELTSYLGATLGQLEPSIMAATEAVVSTPADTHWGSCPVPTEVASVHLQGKERSPEASPSVSSRPASPEPGPFCAQEISLAATFHGSDSLSSVL